MRDTESRIRSFATKEYEALDLDADLETALLVGAEIPLNIRPYFHILLSRVTSMRRWWRNQTTMVKVAVVFGILGLVIGVAQIVVPRLQREPVLVRVRDNSGPKLTHKGASASSPATPATGSAPPLLPRYRPDTDPIESQSTRTFHGGLDVSIDKIEGRAGSYFTTVTVQWFQGVPVAHARQKENAEIRCAAEYGEHEKGKSNIWRLFDIRIWNITQYRIKVTVKQTLTDDKRVADYYYRDGKQKH